MEDARIKQLRTLIREVIQLQNDSQKLLGDVSEKLQQSRDTADDRPERRKKPRS